MEKEISLNDGKILENEKIVQSDEQFKHGIQNVKPVNSNFEGWQKHLLGKDAEKKYEKLEDFYFAKFEEHGIKKGEEDKNYQYQINDIILAKLFREIHNKIILFVREENKYYVYDGTRFIHNIYLLAEICKEFCTALSIYANKIQGDTIILKPNGEYKQFNVYANSFHNSGRRKSMLADAATIITVSIEIFDNQPLLINCLNGTYDLEEMAFREHRPSDYLTMIFRADYDSEAKCERFNKFISEIMDDDYKKIRYLQKCFGYICSGDISQDSFFCFYGPLTRNGKSTLVGAIEYILGELAKTAQPQTIAKRNINGAAPSPDLARLKGARLINMPEPSKGFELDAALVKQMTGGDPITARLLRSNPIQFIPTFKIVISANHIPKINDPALLLSGRMKVIFFNKTFIDNPDTDLKALFREPEAMSAILNWLIEGYNLYKEDGHLQTPESLRKELEDFHSEASGQLEEFLNSNLKKNENIGRKVRISDIHRQHSTWALESGLKKLSKHAFAAELKRLYPDNFYRDSVLGNSLRDYILLKDDNVNNDNVKDDNVKDDNVKDDNVKDDNQIDKKILEILGVKILDSSISPFLLNEIENKLLYKVIPAEDKNNVGTQIKRFKDTFFREQHNSEALKNLNDEIVKFIKGVLEIKDEDNESTHGAPSIMDELFDITEEL